MVPAPSPCADAAAPPSTLKIHTITPKLAPRRPMANTTRHLLVPKRKTENGKLEEDGRWCARRRVRIEQAAGEDDRGRANRGGAGGIRYGRLRSDEPVSERAQRVAEETVVLRAGGERGGAQPMRVVIVVNGDRIARGVIPLGVERADAHDAGQQCRDRAGTGSTDERTDEPHEPPTVRRSRSDVKSDPVQRDASCARTWPPRA